jgi:tetratricopeptide (TPR) repeat protein/mannosyltransferase OCH1-like enzyme
MSEILRAISPGKDEPAERVLMEQGRAARASGDRAAALAAFQKAIEANKVPTHVAPRLDAATELRELGRLAEAEQLYAEIHTQDASNVAAWMGLGHCARRRGDRAVALAAFQKGMTEGAPAKNFGPHQVMAAELRTQGRITDAEDLYHDIIAQVPESFSALVGLGLCARQLGQHEKALAYFDDARARSMNSEMSPALASIEELCLLGRFDEAEQRAQVLHDYDPSHPAPLISLAKIARARGRHLAALDRFQLAKSVAITARSESQTLSAVLEIVIELRILGRPIEAAAICQTALKANPTNSHVIAALAHCHRQLGHRRDALAAFQSASRLDPLNLSLQLQIVTEQRELGDTHNALLLLEEMGRTNPDNLNVHVERARIYRQQDWLEKALAELKRGVAQSPLRADLQLELADTLSALGRPDEARDCVEKVLAVLPNQPRALGTLAEFERMGMNFKSAEGILRHALALTPDRPAAHLALGRLLQLLGRPNEAMTCIESATKAIGNSPDIILQRIAMLNDMGRWEAALPIAREAAAGAPWHMGIWEHWFRLVCLEGDLEAIESCLAATPAHTVREQARLAFLRGIYAGSHWRLEEAIAWQQKALRLNPQLASAFHELGRLSLLTLDIETTRECLKKLARLSATMTRLQGRSANISQTHIGVVADEFRIDAALLIKLRSLLKKPPAQRVAQLLSLERQHSRSTAIAVMLLVALRQADLLRNRHTMEPVRIPTRITQFWDSPELPEDLAPLRESWRAMNPGYSYQLFSEHTAGLFLLKTCGTEAFAAFARAREPAQKADLFRLGYLALNGGVYADCDDRCLTPLDRWLPLGASLVVYQENFGTLGNNFIACEPRSPVIVRALQNAVTAVNRGDADVLWLSTGPGALSRAFAQVFAERTADSAALLDNCYLLDHNELLRVCHVHSRAAYKTTASHWSNTAFGRNRVAVSRCLTEVQ